MDKKNIIFNMTLEEYNQKYKYKKLRKLRKIEVDNTPELLGKKTWSYIDDVYYEIPKSPSYHWFRNLSNSIQIGICVALGCVIATAVIVPTAIYLNQNKTIARIIVIEGGSLKNSTPLKENNNLVVDLTCANDNHEITEITKVIVGNIELTADDYVFDKINHKLTIKKSGLDKAGENEKIKIVVVESEKKEPVIIDDLPDYLKINNEGVITFDKTSLESAPSSLVIKNKYKKDGNDLTVTSIGCFDGCPSSEITINDSITKMENGAFNFNNDKLTKINLSSNLTTIPKEAFKNCSKLSAINVLKNIEEIGESAFEGCTVVSILTFEENSKIKKIGAKCFYSMGSSCGAAYAITLPATLELINAQAFDGAKLNEITFTNTAGWTYLSGGGSANVSSPVTNANYLTRNNFQMCWGLQRS